MRSQKWFSNTSSVYGSVTISCDYIVHNYDDPNKDDTAIIDPIAIVYIVGAIDNIC